MRALITTAVLLTAGTSEAGHKLFMLRANSTTDWGTRTNVEKTVVGLARNVDRGVSRGDMSFADLATSVGCTKDLDGCKSALLDALMLDELVVVTIEPAGDDKVKVVVQRASKKGIREATGVVNKADPVDGLVASIGPLFGAKKLVGDRPAPQAAPSKTTPPGKGTMTLGTAEVDNEQPPGLKATPESNRVAVEPSKPAPEVTPPKAEPPKPEPPKSEPPKSEPPPPPPTVTAAPDNVVRADGDPDSRRPLYLGGIVAGGVTTIVGIVLWEKASSIQADARVAPNRSSADIAALLDLESSGDHYALAGNLAFFGGLALAGVSGYLFWRSGDAHVTPMAVDHGGGVALTFGAP